MPFLFLSRDLCIVNCADSNGQMFGFPPTGWNISVFTAALICIKTFKLNLDSNSNNDILVPLALSWGSKHTAQLMNICVVVAVLASIRTTLMAMVDGKKSLLFQVWLLERRGGWWCPFRINEYLDSRALPGGRSSNHRPAKTICTAIVKVGLTDGEWVMLISLGSCNHSNPNLNPCNCPHYNCGQVSVRSIIWGAGGGVHGCVHGGVWLCETTAQNQ